jgi:uncharacterized protein with HEPN domain
MRNYLVYLQDIFDAMKAIEDFVKDMSFEEFLKNDMARSAVIRKFEIIGEAANNIPTMIQVKYSEVPWTDMVGMRNILIHQYFAIDDDIVWSTIKNKLPDVKAKIEIVIKALTQE